MPTQRIGSLLHLSHRGQWVGLGLLLGLLGALVAWLAWHQRGELLDQERDRLLVQSRVVAETIGLQLASVDAVLQAVRDDLSGGTLRQQPQEAARRLQALKSVMPGVQTIQVLNSHGVVEFSSRDANTGRDYSDRELFTTPLVRKERQALHLSPPYVSSSGHYSISLSKSWLEADGSFAGVVTARLEPRHYETLLRSAVHAGDMRVSLVHGDGRIFLMVPAGQVPVGEMPSLAASGTLFGKHRAQRQGETVLTGPTVASREERVVVLQDIAPAALHMDHPLVLVLSRLTSEVLAPWRQLASLYALVLALIACFASLGLMLQQKRQRAELALADRRLHEMRTSAERMDQALSGADLATWEFDLASGNAVVNARYCEQLGYPAGDTRFARIGGIVALMHPEDSVRVQAAADDLVAGRSLQFSVEYRVRHAAGHWVWLLSRGKVTARDAQGRATRLSGTQLDVSERKTAEAQIWALAFYDPLTQLPNRRLLLDRIAQAQALGARHRSYGALMFLDLDRFKWLNDNHGHDAGDLLLREVARRLTNCLRESDTVARLGGDEFVVLAQDLGHQREPAQELALQLASKMLIALQQPYALGPSLRAEIGVSIGVTLFFGHAGSAEDLLKQADAAMYDAKAAGRGMVRIRPASTA